jgi:hypothetical protein
MVAFGHELFVSSLMEPHDSRAEGYIRYVWKRARRNPELTPARTQRDPAGGDACLVEACAEKMGR